MFERRNHKPGAGCLRTALAIAAVTAVVASMAIVGTVAAQPGQRFFDVPRTHYAYQSIDWAVTNGITQGCGDGRNFCPADTLNRAQMVTFLKRYHDKFGSDASDASDSSDDGSDPEEHVIDGFGASDDSISLPAGRYSVELTVEHARVLAEIGLIAEDSRGRTLQLLPKTNFTDDGLQTFRGRYTITVGDRLGQLEPGRIYFIVTITDVGNTRSFLAEWEIVVTER